MVGWNRPHYVRGYNNLNRFLVESSLTQQEADRIESDLKNKDYVSELLPITNFG